MWDKITFLTGKAGKPNNCYTFYYFATKNLELADLNTGILDM